MLRNHAVILLASALLPACSDDGARVDTTDPQTATGSSDTANSSDTGVASGTDSPTTAPTSTSGDSATDTSSTLSATDRGSRMSCASYTSPMPPLPSGAMT